MPKYKIFAGLGGGFGGATYITTIDNVEKSDAELEAYEKACNIYYNYGGYMDYLIVRMNWKKILI